MSSRQSRACGVGEQRLKRGAVGEGQGARAGGSHVRVRQVVRLHQLRSLRAGLHMSRPAHDHRHAIALLVRQPALDPHAMRAHHVAVIGGEGDQRAVGLPGLVQRLQHAPDLRIELFGVRVVVRAALAHVVLGHASPGLRFAAVQAGLAGERVGEALGHRNGARVVAVQVLLQRHVGIVRLHEVNFQVPGLRRPWRSASSCATAISAVRYSGVDSSGPSR